MEVILLQDVDKLGTKGTVATVDAGTGASTGTVTVLSGSKCVCSVTGAIVAAQCSVSSTTMTALTAADQTVAYVCL